MYIEQMYTQCLSEAAYYIESNGEAAIIDPIRDTHVYLELAQMRKTTIKYIFETHFHADFVSGHLDLAKATGAQIVYGPLAETRYAKYTAKDQEEFKLGQCTIKAIHTPGHTLESTCYLLLDEKNNPKSLFTGDTLFVGDVGRPDLFGAEVSKEEMASLLFDSLQKISSLPDALIIYPAHGPGSSCGKNLGPKTYSTLGEEKLSNYALQKQTKEEFVKVVTEGLNAPPVYFSYNAKMNKHGYVSLDEILALGLTPISLIETKKLKSEGCILLDTRNANLFTEGFIPESVNIGLEGRFAEWAGALLPFHERIVLVTEEGKEKDSVTRLARVGFDQIIGYVEGGFEAWKQQGESIDMIINVEADELKMDMNYDEHLVILDVRKELEFENGHVKSAINMPLHDLTNLGLIGNFEENDNIYVHCAGGYRSVIASSLLKKQGIHNLRNVLGGYEQIKQVEGMPLEVVKSALN